MELELRWLRIMFLCLYKIGTIEITGKHGFQNEIKEPNNHNIV